MERFRAPLAAMLCLVLSLPSSPAWGQAAPPLLNSPAKRARQPYQSTQLQGDQRILHALSRFTFGPRPGDLEAVKTMSLDKWFDQQLHPATIDQADLESRLAQFPAMQLSAQDLLFRLPSNAVIRQVADGKAPVPSYPALRPIYENEIARVQFRRQEKEQKNQQQASSTAATMTTYAPSATQDGMMAAESTAVAKGQPGNGQMMSEQNQPETLAFDQNQIAAILALPPPQRVSSLAAMQQPQFDSFRKALKQPQRITLLAGLTPVQKEYVAALENPQRLVAEELAAQRLTRDIYSDAQLQEVMTDFWLNHFNVFLHKNEATPYYLVSYERDVIRPLALGKFEDLLEATAHSPAMLLYLDNATSMGPDSPAAEKNKERAARNPDAKKKAPEGLNENYARELMELHTLGVNGGYTQADVTQVARVLTGWTVDRPERGGGFKFDENRHEPGAKKVLGKKIKEHGELEGRELLHMLASRPATAQFISRKLAVRFVSDDPPQALVDRLAKSYMSSGGDIAAVLKTLYHSPEFWADSAYRAKVKTPIEYIVSAARASNANSDNMLPFVNALRDMGMPLYGAVPPTGYKWTAATWISTGALVSRMNFALTLAANKLPGVTVSWSVPAAVWTAQLNQPASPTAAASAPIVLTTPVPGPNAPPDVEEQRLESFLVAGGVSDSTRSAVLQQFAAQSTQTLVAGTPGAIVVKPIKPAQAASALEKQDQLLAGLLLGSPEFQRR
jgi:uncharacterized protein (DUF1800 family)